MGVSYVVTVYNKANFLPEVLQSIAQEYAGTSGEIIIIDDGSTDDSPRILENFARDHADVQIITQTNAGVAAATNRGIAAAQEKYLRLVDGDDVLVANSTTHLIDVLEKTGCGFAFGRFAQGALPAAIAPHTSIVTDPLRRMLMRQPFIPACTLSLTAVIQAALPLPMHFRTAQDFALGLRLASLTGFAETTAFCCVQPAEATGLSADKAGMFRDTVLLTLELSQEWPARYQRLAIARNAGRARNYLRRHVKGRHGVKTGVSILAVIARIPFFWPYRRLMIYIANAYTAPT